MTDKDGRAKGLWWFFLLTYVLMFLTGGIMAIFRIPGASTTPGAPVPPLYALLLLFLAGSSPTIAGLIAIRRFEGRAGLVDVWRRAMQFSLGWKTYLAIVLLPVLGIVLRAAVFVLQGGILGQSALLAQPLNLIPFIIQILVLGPLSEEFGWRGFALERLLSRWNALWASLILGAIWATWHLPLFFLPNTAQYNYGHLVPEFLLFALFTIGSSVLYTQFYLQTKRSLWSAIFFHFTGNFCVSFLVTSADDGMSGRILWGGVMAVAALVTALGWRRNSAIGRALAQ